MSERKFDLESIKQFNNKYSSHGEITKENACDVIAEFLSCEKEWREGIGRLFSDSDGKMNDGEDLYGIALTIYSAAVSFCETIEIKKVLSLQDMFQNYEKNVEFKYVFKYQICLNLGICWHLLGKEYDNAAIMAFKKYLFYLLIQYNRTSYRPIAYSFRSCSTFLYQSLVNETLNLSSPVKFNDPFDCPIISVLDTNDEIDVLMRKAYLDCIKVACFVKNTKLPYLKGDGTIVIEKKHSKSVKEYLNPLMWAHYADSHKGICIQYYFTNEVTKLGGIKHCPYVNYFGDVRYTNDIADEIKDGRLNLSDAFFVKGKCWEYENEMRMLYCNPEDNSPYVALEVPNSIKAVYFGLECSSKDRETIMNILKNKKCLVQSRKSGKIYKRKVLFYQMQKDPEHFGDLISVKI